MLHFKKVEYVAPIEQCNCRGQIRFKIIAYQGKRKFGEQICCNRPYCVQLAKKSLTQQFNLQENKVEI